MESAKYQALVIEDDISVSTLLRFKLENQGYEIVSIKDSKQVESFIDDTQQAPHLIVIDMMLPQGMPLLARIRAKDKWGSVPVIVMTEHSMRHEIKVALDLGANEYILKPFHPSELFARIGLNLKLI